MIKTATELLYLRPEYAGVTEEPARIKNIAEYNATDYDVRQSDVVREYLMTCYLDRTIVQPPTCGQPGDIAVMAINKYKGAVTESGVHYSYHNPPDFRHSDTGRDHRIEGNENGASVTIAINEIRRAVSAMYSRSGKSRA